jgi:predicted nucleic acid-binding protein
LNWSSIQTLLHSFTTVPSAALPTQNSSQEVAPVSPCWRSLSFAPGSSRKIGGLRKIESLHEFLTNFLLIEASSEIANVAGGVSACSAQVGRALSWPDAWAAATALWLDVPLVAHDWDLEGIPGLQVLTVHQNWQVREEGLLSAAGIELQ